MIPISGYMVQHAGVAVAVVVIVFVEVGNVGNAVVQSTTAKYEI